MRFALCLCLDGCSIFLFLICSCIFPFYLYLKPCLERAISPWSFTGCDSCLLLFIKGGWGLRDKHSKVRSTMVYNNAFGWVYSFYFLMIYLLLCRFAHYPLYYPFLKFYAIYNYKILAIICCMKFQNYLISAGSASQLYHDCREDGRNNLNCKCSAILSRSYHAFLLYLA